MGRDCPLLWSLEVSAAAAAHHSPCPWGEHFIEKDGKKGTGPQRWSSALEASETAMAGKVLPVSEFLSPV